MLFVNGFSELTSLKSKKKLYHRFVLDSKTISSNYSCLSCNGAISDQWHLNSLDIKKNDSSDAVRSSLESNPTQR